MTSGPVIIQVLMGDNAVEQYRKIMGATNPDNAEAGLSKRFVKYSGDQFMVLILKNAQIEIQYFFDESEIID